VSATHFGDARAPSVVIVDLAARNGLGVDPATTWALWRAELLGHQPSPFRDDRGERLTMVLQRHLPPRLTGVARLVQILRETLRPLGPTLDALGGRTGVVLAVAERFHDPHAPALRAQRDALAQALDGWCAERPQTLSHGLVAEGHAGFATAAAWAGEALVGGALDVVVVAGVDSYHDGDVVQGLLCSERVFDGKNLDSMTPGEGGAALVLTRPHDAKRAGLATLAVLESVGRGEEPGPMLSDRHVTGDGLTAAIEPLAARAAAMGEPLGWILGDLTNESYRSREHALAFPRAFAPGGLDDGGATARRRALDDLRADWLPLRFGDLGAATLPTAAVLATESFLRGDPAPQRCLLIGTATVAARGAAMLAAPRHETHFLRR
jgi:3-oxoacyl-[acyl-carrier-protein] synthase-1